MKHFRNDVNKATSARFEHFFLNSKQYTPQEHCHRIWEVRLKLVSRRNLSVIQAQMMTAGVPLQVSSTILSPTVHQAE